MKTILILSQVKTRRNFQILQQEYNSIPEIQWDWTNEQTMSQVQSIGRGRS